MLTVWVVLIIFAVLIDLITSNIMFSWLTIGFALAIIANLFGLEGSIQVIIAALIGVIAFMFGTRISRNYLTKNIMQTPILTDKLVGVRVKSDKRIEGNAQHKINGIYWTVFNEGQVIEPGEEFEVFGIKNNKLYIVKVD